MHLEEITATVYKIIKDNKNKKYLSEKFVQENQPSIEINDYLSDCQNLLFQLEQMYFKNTENRNVIVPKSLELIAQIKERSDLALENLKQSNPEDTNK